MTTEQENKNKRTAWIASIVIHGLLLIAFIFMIAWREPNPPYPEYGIEVNFGVDNSGSGDIQPTTPANESENIEESDPAPAQEETVEEVVEETTIEQVVEDVAEPVEEAVSEEVVAETITQPNPSPDVIEEVTEEVEEVTPELFEEEPQEEQPEEPAVTPVLYSNDGDNASDGTGESNDDAQQANHGDDADATGDEGQEDGTLDARTLYGNQGGGGGAPALNMSGWMWDFTPKPNDTSNENGRIVFEVKIDDEGEIISVRTLERSVSTTVEKIYRQEIEKLTFTKTSDNHSTAAVSTGTITFVIRSK